MATDASISTDYRMMVKALEDAIRLVSEALPLLEQADALFTRYLQAPAEHHTLLRRRHTQIRYSLQGAQTPTPFLDDPTHVGTLQKGRTTSGGGF